MQPLLQNIDNYDLIIKQKCSTFETKKYDISQAIRALHLVKKALRLLLCIQLTEAVNALKTIPLKG